MNDLMMLKGLDAKDGFTPYEQVKVGHMQSKRASGVAIGALVTAAGAAVLAIGAGAWAGSRAQNAKEVATAKNDGLKDLVQSLANSFVAERAERIEGDKTLSISINDQVSGSQQGSLSQSQQLSNDIMLGIMTGKYSENAQKVELMTPAQPFKCGCGCTG